MDDLEIFLGVLPNCYDVRWQKNSKKHITSKFYAASAQDQLDLIVNFNYDCRKDELSKLEYLSVVEVQKMVKLRLDKF